MSRCSAASGAGSPSALMSTDAEEDWGAAGENASEEEEWSSVPVSGNHSR